MIIPTVRGYGFISMFNSYDILFVILLEIQRVPGLTPGYARFDIKN